MLLHYSTRLPYSRQRQNFFTPRTLAPFETSKFLGLELKSDLSGPKPPFLQWKCVDQFENGTKARNSVSGKQWCSSYYPICSLNFNTVKPQLSFKTLIQTLSLGNECCCYPLKATSSALTGLNWQHRPVRGQLCQAIQMGLSGRYI